MVVPDFQLVAEVILFSEGFDKATWLARKMVTLYRMASEQLSNQVNIFVMLSRHFELVLYKCSILCIAAFLWKSSSPR
jgi:hypothetical protein